jgi:hypothetical protein
MKRDLFFVIAMICAQGYMMVPALWESAPTPASVSYPIIAPIPYKPAPTPSTQPTQIVKPVPTATPVATNTPTVIKAERVLIVSFDGMRPDAIPAAPMTNLLKLIKSSAYTFKAMTISYPTTLPSHTAMLSGMCMEKNGVRWNGNNLYRGYSNGDDLFDLTNEASMFSAMIVGKDKLRQIAQPETTSDFEVYSNETSIAQSAIKVIDSGFDLLFVHFPSADLRGHKYGWMTNAQFKALREGDAALADILAALDKNGMRETTLVIVTADHGGHGKDHDGTRMEDYLIPWIASGPGIVSGELTYPIKTMDTAATAAYALGLPFQPEWDGIPVYQAFGQPQQDVHFDKGCK